MRAALRALLAGAPEAPSASSPAQPAFQRPMMPSGDGGALADYIRDRVHDDLFPLAKECYQRALEKNPELGGKLIVSFTIAGDQRVGGVVDSAKVEPSSTLRDQEVSDCVRESMMSVSFDAPPDGQSSVSVTYPILFLPGDEPDAS